MHRLRVSLAAILVVLTVQGWTGDFVNLFAPFSTPGGSVGYSLNWLVQTLFDSGGITTYHAFEGALLVVLSVAVLVLSFRSSGAKSIRACAVLATAAVVSAALGGTLFVLSGFLNSANSAQMGGSFIGAYAFYFLELFYAK